MHKSKHVMFCCRFIEVEDKNFALFNFVNEQNNEIEQLNEDIEEVSFCVSSLCHFFITVKFETLI